jgi:hypothetical protein
MIIGMKNAERRQILRQLSRARRAERRAGNDVLIFYGQVAALVRRRPARVAHEE